MTKRLICGVALNDSDYPTTRTENNKIVWRCPYYKRWMAMILRCYSVATQARNPAYVGCTVCKDWLTFSKFREWMVNQDWGR